MLVLTLRTDKPDAEIGLYKDKEQLAYITWKAHRKLAETIHSKIQELLQQKQLSFSDLDGLVLYKGPGSFTGLRIGASVIGVLSYSLDKPMVGITGSTWQADGIAMLQAGKRDEVISLEYGSPAHTTQPKK